MNRIITLQVTHLDQDSGPLTGFRFFWAFRVSGFRSDRHCQPCFRGSLVKDFSSQTVRTARTVDAVLQPQHQYLYVCGVGSGPRRERYLKNFHLPLRYEAGSSVSRTTYNGYVVTASNAVEVDIPALAPDWNGRDLETTRCKNFQFGVRYFGADGAGPVPSVRAPA
jgi:hypothetical protein